MHKLLNCVYLKVLLQIKYFDLVAVLYKPTQALVKQELSCPVTLLSVNKSSDDIIINRA